MIISTLNVNGVRSAVTKGLLQWITEIKADVICFQELKATKDQIPENLIALPFHQVYKPAEKKGYSGVGILAKKEPIAVYESCGIDWIDAEGRFVAMEFDTYCVISAYFPSGTTGEERQAVKYQFLDEFMVFIHEFKTKLGKEIILCGDLNIAHEEIDIHNPISNKNSSGFLPEERAWFTKFLKSGFVDVYRNHNPELRDVYSWWTFRAGARKNNKGWRIDYQLTTPKIAEKVVSARIDTEYVLSDHTSVTVEYDLSH
jgi:exodeoxyribonuclease-3